MAKIVFVGAGSTVFAKNLLTDILLIPELRDSEIVLQDIDKDRLSTSMTVAQRIRGELKSNSVITCTDDQKKALINANYVSNRWV